jgi:hypothetical protein
MSCDRCGAPGTTVWVVEDPYYGYGHYPKLRCDACGIPDDWRYDGHHKYHPSYDDHFLGLTKKAPLAMGTLFNGKIHCYDCRKTFGGPGECTRHLQVYLPDELWNRCHRYYGSQFLQMQIEFCEDCANKRYREDRHSSEYVKKEMLALTNTKDVPTGTPT